jgi:hypothetical protein
MDAGHENVKAGDVVPLAWQEHEADQIAEPIYDDRDLRRQAGTRFVAEAVQRSWRRPDGHHRSPKLIIGVSSPTESRPSDRKLKPLPRDPFHQDSAMAHR